MCWVNHIMPAHVCMSRLGKDLFSHHIHTIYCYMPIDTHANNGHLIEKTIVKPPLNSYIFTIRKKNKGIFMVVFVKTKYFKLITTYM